MDKLIQTKVASIIYGDFKGKPNQELFRCPRELDHIDLVRYVNENRSLVEFEDDYTEDLHKPNLIGYWRMYYRDGWALRWFGEHGKPTRLNCAGAQKIIDWIMSEFKRGCDYHMCEYMDTHFRKWGKGQRYMFRPVFSDCYKVMIDTTYGNHDYPVRVYVYKER